MKQEEVTSTLKWVSEVDIAELEYLDQLLIGMAVTQLADVIRPIMIRHNTKVVRAMMKEYEDEDKTV